MYGLCKPELKLISVGFGALLISSLSSMYIPTGIGKIIDLTNSNISVENYIFYLSGVVVLGSIGTFIRALCFNIASERLIKRLRNKLFKNITKQDIEFFDRTQTGELVNRLSTDVFLMSKSISGASLSQGVRSIAQTLFCLGYMYYLSPTLTGIVFSIIPIIAITSVAYGRYIRTLSRKVTNALAEATDVAHKRISNIRLVRSFGKEADENKVYNNAVLNIYNLAVKEALASSGFFSFVNLAGSGSLLAVLYFGTNLVHSSTSLTPGLLTSFLMYAVYLGISTASLSSFYGDLMKAIGSSHRVFKLLDQQPKIGLSNQGITLKNGLKGYIEFNNVNFTYPNRNHLPIFHNLNFKIYPGQTIAIVGSSGVGKSTVSHLLLRFYDVTKGKIMIDDYNVQDYNITWLRQQIGVVSQNLYLYNGTIAENIAYSNPNVSLEQIISCAKQANCHEFISELKDGYNTFIGENGIQLSGGQKQRLCIARALIISPKILILDEATSALDSTAEKLIQNALDNLIASKSMTIIIIAHRLTTVKNSDQIIVLHDKQIAEQGNHHELIAKNGIYKKLINLHK